MAARREIYHNNLRSEYHIRYGGYGGIAYHHVSDTYIALFNHFITCGVWEAVYILDGLLKNTSDIQPDTLHADTQGQSTTVFGLAYLLGIKLQPRIRNWQASFAGGVIPPQTWRRITSSFVPVRIRFMSTSTHCLKMLSIGN